MRRPLAWSRPRLRPSTASTSLAPAADPTRSCTSRPTPSRATTPSSPRSCRANHAPKKLTRPPCPSSASRRLRSATRPSSRVRTLGQRAVWCADQHVAAHTRTLRGARARAGAGWVRGTPRSHARTGCRQAGGSLRLQGADASRPGLPCVSWDSARTRPREAHEPVPRTRWAITGRAPPAAPLVPRAVHQRFLRDGHQTVLEDRGRLHYEPHELRVFEHIGGSRVRAQACHEGTHATDVHRRRCSRRTGAGTLDRKRVAAVFHVPHSRGAVPRRRGHSRRLL